MKDHAIIFVTLGSQKFQFNRLLKALDDQVSAGKIKDDVFAQIGASDYKPAFFEYTDFVDRDVYAEYMRGADIVITHGGTGAIVGAIKKGKKVIAVPRLKRFGEHVDDHQLQLTKQFKELDLICECLDCDEIWKDIETVKETTYKSYESNTQTIIDSIDGFLQQM